MDAQSSQDQMGAEQMYSPHQTNQPDQDMGGTEETTAHNPAYGNGYSNAQRGAHYVSQPADYPPSVQTFSPSLDGEQGSRYNSPSLAYQQQGQSTSRPDSGLSGAQQDYQRQYQEQNQRQQSTANKNSVVIKVGMVGDAQIGKTSLMVKYVEGSWDEDYIQTLGKPLRPAPFGNVSELIPARRELHGKDHLNPQYRDHLLNLGSGWSARIRQYASSGVQ